MIITERKINALRQMAERGSPEERRSAKEKLAKIYQPKQIQKKFSINDSDRYSLIARKWNPKTNEVFVWTVAYGQINWISHEISTCRNLTVPGFNTFYLCNASDEKRMKEILHNKYLKSTDYYYIGKMI